MIGQSGESLLCTTNNANCCEDETSGGWTLPNKMNISTSLTPNLAVTQHYGKQFVQLTYHEEQPQPMGIFVCNIRDATNTLNHFHIGIYGSNDNSGKLVQHYCLHNLMRKYVLCSGSTECNL